MAIDQSTPKRRMSEWTSRKSTLDVIKDIKKMKDYKSIADVRKLKRKRKDSSGKYEMTFGPSGELRCIAFPSRISAHDLSLAQATGPTP